MPKSLEDKITSEAELTALGLPRVRRQILNAARNDYYMPWWLKREWLRIERAVYPEASAVVISLNDLNPQFALHVSKEDPNYVAYTPDKVSGEADRQLKTSLGKFLAKYYPHYKDEDIQNLVADHLGEVTGEVELIYGKDIVNVYNRALGSSSCMSKSTTMFNLDGHHPAEVYDMPNIAMAICRDTSGNVTGRSMVYMPSETDKRYIRIYGDRKLEKRLKRAGFKAGYWHGAEFKKVEYAPGRFLMPYLDGRDTAGTTGASAVVYMDGKLLSIDGEKTHAIRSACGESSVVVCLSTGGWQNFHEVKNTDFTKTCAVSGVVVNCLIDRLWPYVIDVNARTKVMVCKEVYDAGLIVAMRLEGSPQVQEVSVPPDTPTFFYGGRITPDTDSQRRLAGYSKLDPTYYPDEQDWVAPGAWGSDPEGYVRVDGHYYKKVDIVRVIKKGVGLLNVHQQTIGKGWTKVHSIHKGEDLYAEPGTEIVKTGTGRKVVPTVHAVAETWEGTWEFTRNLTRTSVYGQRVWHKRTEVFHVGSDNTAHFLYKAIETRMKKGYDLQETLVYMVRDHVTDYIEIGGRSLYAINIANVPTWPELFKIAMLDDHVRTYAVRENVLKQLNYFYETWTAQANAIDCNEQHDVTMNTCEETVPAAGATVPLPSGGTTTTLPPAWAGYSPLTTLGTATTILPPHYMAIMANATA